MGPHSSPVDSGHASTRWQRLADALDELSASAPQTDAPLAFYRQVLARVVPAGGVSRGAVWIASAGSLRLEAQFDAEPHASDAAPSTLAARQVHVERALQDNQTALASAAPADGWIGVGRFRAGPEVAGVIELHMGTSAAESRHDVLHLASALVELLEDYHRQRELAELRERQQALRQFETFVLRAHDGLDARQTAFALANEGRRIVQCDRLSVLVRAGRRYHAAAVSGVDVLDRRALQVRLMETLAARAAAAGEPLLYADTFDDLPEEISRPLQDYLDQSHARVLAIVPLAAHDEGHGERSPLGVLVAEQYHACDDLESWRERLLLAARHGGLALSNALVHSRMPLAPVSRALARLRWLTAARQLPKTVLALAAVVAVVAALAIIPADFEIDVKGTLQPQVRREVFASDNGVVSELLVRHGSRVDAAQPLAVLRKPELDLELRRVAGEIQTAEKKLAAVRAARLTNARNDQAASRDAHQMTADEEELKQLLTSLADQRAILEQQREALTLRSPLGGEVLTWNVHQLLAGRPVERGQALLTVADLAGPWVVELRLPDDRAGAVLTAQRDLKPQLDVAFALTAEPEQSYRGQLSELALTTEVDEVAGPTVLGVVAFDRQQVDGLRPGATVLARIHCGRASLGYVWFHDLYEFVQTHWWW